MGRDSRTKAAKAVLIPLGRSLQRNSAAPDFFAYPRAVVAVDAEPAGTGDPYLKDRLYLGYQEKANLLEVISYNEDAGRFEFQVVTDYRAGGTPRVMYANRTLCVACHQNAAPIFSRAVWDETNANPRVAALLASQRKDFHGIPVDRGVDVPNAIDDAALRANRFAVQQLLWKDGCGGNDEPAVDVSRRIVRGAAPVPALRAAAIRPRRRVVSRRGRGPGVGDRAPAMAGRARARQSRSSESQPAAGRGAGVVRDRSSRWGAACACRRRVRSAAAASAAGSLARRRTGRRGASCRRPRRFHRRSGCGAPRQCVAQASARLSAPHAGPTEAPARSSPRWQWTAASASNSAARRRRRRPSAAYRWKADCSWSGTRCPGARSIASRSTASRRCATSISTRGVSMCAAAQRVAVLTPLRGRLHARGADGNALERIELRWGDARRDRQRGRARRFRSRAQRDRRIGARRPRAASSTVSTPWHSAARA